MAGCPKWQLRGSMLASSFRAAVLALTFLCSAADVGVGVMKALNVYGGALSPVFDPTVFDYELDLDDEGTLQTHKDFATLGQNLSLSPAGGEDPSVILAPHLSTAEYKDKKLKAPRLFVDNREVPYKSPQSDGNVAPHIAISRKELLEASFRREDGRHAYSLILLEVHVPKTETTASGAAAVDGDLAVLRYIIRVHNTVNRAEEAKQRQLLAKAAPVGWSASPVAEQPLVKPVPGGFAEVMKGSSTVAIKLADGFCVRTNGPFTGKPLVPPSSEALGLYEGDSPHIVCFGDKLGEAASDEEEKFKFTVARFGSPSTDFGKFGFGPGARVALRPEVATDAIWPLQEGVQSLGVPLQDDDSFRVIGLRAHGEDGKQIDLPMVMTRTRKEDWPLDVQFVNSSMGSCNARPGPDNLLLFVCRAKKDVPSETPAQFIAFCPDCSAQDSDDEEDGKKSRLMMKVESEGGGLIGGRQASATLQVASSWNSDGPEKPWAAWTTEVPAYGLQRNWAIKVQPAQPSGRQLNDGVVKDVAALETRVFQVLFVDAETTLAFESVTLTSEEKDKLVTAGMAMSQAALLIMTLLGAVAVATFVLSLPNRLLAVLPSLSAAALSLQFLALAGNLPTAPEPLRALAGPLAWLSPGSPKSTFLACIGVFAIVLLVHGLAVCKFIVYNGKGSAQSLPHGLSFGGWELRALGVLAFPVAANAATYMVPLLVPSQRYSFWFFVSLPALTVLGGLAFLVVFTWRRVSKALSEDEVLLMNLPAPVGSQKDDGYPIFTDHFCDQLRSIPSDAGSSTLLADWLATPSWCLKPEVASIHIVEHRGARLFKPSMFQWCSQNQSGPWRAHSSRQQTEDDQSNDPNVVKLPSDYTLYKLGIKQAPTATTAQAVYHTVQAEVDAMRTTGSIASSATALWGNTTTSELVMEHPISIKTNFAYQASQMAGGTVAGVRCLSWINCAIPAATLVKLEGHLQGEVALRTQVGQMSGPVSGGRFAACFDWGVLWPWNWPAEVALKIMLGIWAAMLPFAGQMSPSMATLVNSMTMGLAVTCAWAAVVFRPYVHIFDILATVCARTAIALTLGACLMLDNSVNSALTRDWGSFVPAMLAVAVLTLVPLFVLFIATMILTVSMVTDGACRGCMQGQKAAEELLQKYWEEGKKNDDFYAQIDINKHMIDIVFQDMHPAPRLPALVRSPVEHLRLQPSPGRRGSCTQLPSVGKPWLSLVPSLLFPLATNRSSTNSRSSTDSRRTRSAAPIAALTEAPDDGRLLFQERANNGGLDWREVLHSFVDSIDEDCATEAERLIQAYEFPLEGAGAERSLVIIELVPTDMSTGLFSMIR